MSVINTAFSENSINTIYQPPGANSFNPDSFIVSRASNTEVVFEAATASGIRIRAETIGTFPTVARVGTPVTELLNSNAGVLITGENVYVNDVLYQTIRYSSPVLASDSFNVDRDATSSLYRKIYSGDDVFIGSATLQGAGDDKVAGYAGDDLFYGFGDEGADLFDGGAGIDTSVYRGVFANYEITKDQFFYNPTTDRNDLRGTQVKDTTGLDGTDGLVNVERLQFADTMVALDIAPNQTAGKVYMLYQATFNRTPDTEGLGYWIKQVDNGANITTDVAAFFVTSPEFVAKYGANPSVASYVYNLYLNVLGRPGEAGGVAYWNQELNAGTITRAAVLEAFATLPEGAALVANAIANGIQYQEWLG